MGRCGLKIKMHVSRTRAIFLAMWLCRLGWNVSLSYSAPVMKLSAVVLNVLVSIQSNPLFNSTQEIKSS
jgi:hypothetical protein